jgi:hypothetical protein
MPAIRRGYADATVIDGEVLSRLHDPFMKISL